jgi:hypothetical protein
LNTKCQRKVYLALIGLFYPFTIFAANGGVVVYVDDGVAQQCVNRSTDSIWVTLRRLIVTKPPDGWFTSQKDIAVYLNPTLATTGAKAPSFPLLTKVSYGDSPAGQVSIPIEYTIIDSYSLNQGSATYTGLQVDVTLLNENSRSKWGEALSSLEGVTKKLPIPVSNPYVQGAGYLLDFANNLIDGDIKSLTSKNASDVAKSGAISLTFSPDGQCVGDFASTGTAAILQASGPAGDGHVDIGNLVQYCLAADLRPTFSLKEAPLPAGGNCKALPAGTQFKAVTNNYAAFFVNAVKTPKTLAGLNAKERAVAETRCSNNGVPKATCLHH